MLFVQVMTKGMEIVNDCGPGTEHYAKGFKPPMLAPLLEITDKLHLERWYAWITSSYFFSNTVNLFLLSKDYSSLSSASHRRWRQLVCSEICSVFVEVVFICM